MVTKIFTYVTGEDEGFTQKKNPTGDGTIIKKNDLSKNRLQVNR